MSSLQSDVLLVGSVPFETVEDVLGTAGRVLDGRVLALPDGEVGPRSVWIGALPHLTYAKNPDLEPLNLIDPEDVKSPDGHQDDLIESTLSTFRLKPGVRDTEFDLHFEPAAIESYATFRRLRDEGVIAPGVRFQVSLPFPFDGTFLFFPEAQDRRVAMRAYERANRRTIQRILEHVPADDLVIQWDYCVELLDILGWTEQFVPWTPSRSQEERFEEHTNRDYVAPLSKDIPAETLVGYHLCYGTWGGWPDVGVPDIDLCVRLANALVAHTPHRVDFVHLPAMRETSETFFEPLERLDIGDTKVFLGIELSDGVDALVKRAADARTHLRDFGVAHYCGYGREEPQRVRELLDELRTGAERLAAERTGGRP